MGVSIFNMILVACYVIDILNTTQISREENLIE
jgi:hypothetical protein